MRGLVKEASQKKALREADMYIDSVHVIVPILVQPKELPWRLLLFRSATLEQYAPWRHFQEEKERQRHVTAMIEEMYDDLQKEVKRGKELTLSKTDMTILLEKKLEELPTSTDVEDMWMERFRLPLVKWLE